MKVTFKNELGKRVADKVMGISPTRLNYLVNTFIGEIRDALQRGEVVELRGLGRFSVRPRAARPGRHPRTGVPIQLPAHKVVHYRPADDLNRKFNPKQPKQPMVAKRGGDARPRFATEDKERFIDELGGTGI